EKALNAIRNLIAPRARLVRDGRREVLPVRNIVPGDVVLLEAGDRVPADLRLIKARSLLIEEAILTGESVAAEKHAAPAPAAASLGDRHSMAYSGTFVAAGQAAGVAVGTGTNTEIGRISTLLGSVETLTTPLLGQINRFGTRFTWIALGIAAALFVVAVLLRGYPWQEALVVVVALAVGAVPEGLPAVITITLAIGVQRMAQRSAAIRRLPAVETLGAITVICSDKTGTLTRNEMMARRVEVAAGRIFVTGSGYSPEGTLEPAPPSEARELLAAASPLLRAAVLCNNAELREAEGQRKVSGDPMEGALLALAMKAGMEPGSLSEEGSRIDAIRFDARNRFMATLNRSGDGDAQIFVKGAPERVLRMCRTQARNGSQEPIDPEYWTGRIAEAAAEGERLLAFAMEPEPTSVDDIDFHDVEEGLVFLGLAGFIDPPRAEAIAAIGECHSAGIAVKMITGDHGTTAAAIARQLGLDESPVVMTGADLDRIDDDQLPDLVGRTSVFARTSPEHKLRIVRALQSRNEIVAM